jgi:tRNA nucleotidyltransferase (CCA-adding enzyme)
MMVLQQAVKLSEILPAIDIDQKIAVRFAAVCHDLGKGLTQEPLLPSHKGHEKSGLSLVEKICKQLKVASN